MVDVMIFHPGTQHSYQLAIAMEENKIRYKYLTSFFYKDTSIPYSLIKNFSKLDSKLRGRRYSSQISQRNIINIPYYEIFEYLYKQIFKTKQNKIDRLIHWRDRAFDYHVCKYYLKKLKPKVVIGYPNASYYTFMMAKGLGIKTVLDMPIGFYEYAEKIFEEEKRKHPEFADSITYDVSDDFVYKQRVKKELEIADYVLVPSKFVAKTLESGGFDRGKFVYIPYGSNFEILSADSLSLKQSGELRLLYVGSISQRKGIKYILEAVKSLKEEGYKIQLTMVGKIIGKGEWMDNYNNVFKHVPFTERRKLREIYLNHDVFVFPSLFEGSAMVILEALSNGLPVITTTNTGAEAIVEGYNGFVVDIRDIETMKDRILFFYNDREALNRFKINSLEIARQFTWEVYRRKLYEFICKII